MFTSKKTTSSQEDNSRAELELELETWWTILFCALLRLWVLRVHLEEKCAPCDTFHRNDEPNCVPEMKINYLQYIPIYLPFHRGGAYKLSIQSFLEYCYTIL